jgi:HEPN domain-containing protein
MSDPTDPLAWAARAEEDYALAQLALRRKRPLTYGQDSLQRLAAYAVQVRYPGEDPTVEEARIALKTAQAVRRYARKLLGASA